MNYSSYETSDSHNVNLPAESVKQWDIVIFVTATIRRFLHFRTITALDSINPDSTIDLQCVEQPLGKGLQDYSLLLNLHLEMPQIDERREDGWSSDSDAKFERSEICQLSYR